MLKTKFTYDELDRVATQTVVVRVTGGPDEEHVTRFGYDDLGNQSYVQEPSGAVTRSVDNRASELIEVTAAQRWILFRWCTYPIAVTWGGVFQ